MKITRTFYAVTLLLVTFLVSNLAGETAEALTGKRLVNSEFSQVKAESKQSRKSCSISGRLFGSGIQRDSSYYVVPSDPDRDESRSRMARIDAANPSYRLSSLPVGRYVLRVFRSESGSLLPVKTFPRQREVNCTSSAITNVDFEVE